MQQVERDDRILRERIAGRTLSHLAKANGLSIEGCRLLIVRESRRRTDDLIRRLKENVGTDQLEVLLIPNGPDLQMALAYARWSLDQLSRRGVRVRVHPRVVPNHGVALGLELEGAESSGGNPA